MAEGNKKKSIIIRSWPKIIFLYPIMFTCFICGVCQSFMAEGNADGKELVGAIFFFVFCLNLLVIAFEFSRFKTMSIAFFAFAVFFFILYLSKDFEIMSWLEEKFGNLDITISTTFYYWLSLYFLIIFACVIFTTRFDYWEIKSNEILHKEGFLGDVRRYPSPNLRMSKEISDVFEFLLTGSGRIVLSPASERTAIVLNHVLRVNTVEKRVQELLSSLSVDIREDDDDADTHSIGG